ncbi:MAG TPA: GNAT family N-acetyltransferase [Solirubrobacterales bacterium]|nr:GNAT family N-acetyltransferase [Solirubrobacterales bacterium]
MGAEELLTRRLRLRRLRDSDLEAMTAVNSDPEVTEFLSQPVDEEATRIFLEKTSSHWDEHGFGHWALELREGPDAGALIGFAGVAYPAFLQSLAHRPEIGWRLARPAWGRGLATEAALATRDDAFDRLGLTELISIIDPHNTRSRRVAEKLGMRVEGHDSLHGRTVEVWVLHGGA